MVHFWQNASCQLWQTDWYHRRDNQAWTRAGTPVVCQSSDLPLPNQTWFRSAQKICSFGQCIMIGVRLGYVVMYCNWGRIIQSNLHLGMGLNKNLTCSCSNFYDIFQLKIYTFIIYFVSNKLWIKMGFNIF